MSIHHNLKTNMINQEPEYLDCVTLARQYDTSNQVIKNLTMELKALGYDIPILYWGKQRKIKVHGKQFRKALLAEYGEKKGERY